VTSLTRNIIQRASVLFAASRRFVAAWVMRRPAMKFRAVLSGSFAARGQRSAITLAKIEAVIHMPVEMIWAVPKSRTDEYTA
jgi:hypothetical protein